MKHAREDYNRIQDPAGLIPADEPVFLLRGQDTLSPGILMEYVERFLVRGGDKEMAQMITNWAKEMICWQGEHKVKLADIPIPQKQSPMAKVKSRGLFTKYFVLKPEGNDAYAKASRYAMKAYARDIENVNSILADDIQDWVDTIEEDLL